MWNSFGPTSRAQTKECKHFSLWSSTRFVVYLTSLSVAKRKTKNEQTNINSFVSHFNDLTGGQLYVNMCWNILLCYHVTVISLSEQGIDFYCKLSLHPNTAFILICCCYTLHLFEHFYLINCIYNKHSEISGPYGCKREDDCLLGCCAV